MAYRIRTLRTAANLSQAELAEKAGVARQTVVALEGDALPTCKTDTLSKIANALNCKVSELFLD